MGKPDFREGQVEKWGENREIREIRVNFSNFALEGQKSSFLHVLDPNSPSFYVKCPRKCRKTYNFDIF